MASSFFSDFGLMWYLEELRKEEFRKFKEHLKKETLELGLKQIPWTEVKKASREDLANLLIEHYEEQQAWDVTFRIFHQISRKDLCEKAERERTGHMKMYRAHVKKKFSNIWSRESVTGIHDHFNQELTPEECKYLELFFAHKETGERSRTVLLKGVQGVGKTTLLIKLMLAWSENTLYQDTFQYVFYLSCREVKQLTATSLAELISREWPNSSAPIAEIMFQPERLLFIIDSFEELKCDLDEPESNLHNDWMEKQPVRVLLSSLLRKKMLSESSLLIAATHEYPREVEGRLECPEIKTLMGFTEADRKLYFCCLFQDRNKAMEAFHFVRENDHLFSMCQIPLLCWIVCTSLKQEMEKGRDLALACRRSTSLFASFIFNLFTSSVARRTRQQSQGLLISLCSLAAEGMWTDTSAFSEDDLRRNGIADPDIPMLLGVKVLKHREDESSYTFIHMRVQEFCAAMFYLLKSHSDHPHPAVGCAEALLFNYLKTVKTHWILLGCFVFGLLNEKEQQRLDAFFGFQLSQKIKQQYYQYLKSLAEREDLKRQVDFLALFYCLFEMQNEDFIRQAMHFLQDVNFSIADNSDLVVSAYCLKYCSGLKKLQFSIQNVFQETNGHSCMSSRGIIRWHRICSVLTTNENLRELKVKNSDLNTSAFVALCDQLRHPRCHLEKLEMNNVSFSGNMWHFFEVLVHNPGIKFLSLSSTKLARDEVTLLCDALNHPVCNIEELRLANCGLTSDDCQVFSSVLNSSKKLKHLNVSYNYLHEGVCQLCKSLCHPDCALEVLILAYCYLTEHCWECLSEVFLHNKSLVHLDLSANILKDEGLKILCEALKHPDCCLQSLCLVKCFITTEGCQDLTLVLTSNQNLRSLQIGYNDVEDVGVKLLCEALIHPNCCLENLGLEACGLTSACCEALSSALTSCKTLRRLNLVQNALDHSGVAVLCEALRHPECALEVLGLKKAEFDEETQTLLMAEEERNPDLRIINS